MGAPDVASAPQLERERPPEERREEEEEKEEEEGFSGRPELPTRLAPPPAPPRSHSPGEPPPSLRAPPGLQPRRPEH
jgi:hypothetical protein